MSRAAIGHLKVISHTKQPLPVTATGYRSRFVPREAVEAYGGPMDYVTAGLDDPARSPGWQAQGESF